MALIVDNAYISVTPGQLATAGYSGIIGYVSENTKGKNITASQVRAFLNAGLDVGFVYEYNPDSPLQGSAEAARNADEAIHDMSNIGVPANVACYIALDRNFTDAQMPSVRDYVKTFSARLAVADYRDGIYGGYDQLKYMVGNGYTGLLWQTYAWSRGLWIPEADLRQTQNGITIAGDDLDKDQVMSSDWGQWRTTGQPTPPRGKDTILTHWQTVQAGSKGPFAKVAQGLLLAHGLSVGSKNGEPDGLFGPVSEKSTIQLQTMFHIKRDGVFGSQTLSVALYGKVVS